MITCKTDLIDTYILNDYGVVLDKYLACCREFGITSYTYDNYYSSDPVVFVSSREATVQTWSGLAKFKKFHTGHRQLSLSDFDDNKDSAHVDNVNPITIKPSIIKPSITVGGNYLITCDNWFYNSEGKQCRAVWGTVTAVLNDTEALGIKTNARATNWFIQIGNMLVAGCQIHYAIKCANKPTSTVVMEEYDKEKGKVVAYRMKSSVYDANECN